MPLATNRASLLRIFLDDEYQHFCSLSVTWNFWVCVHCRVNDDPGAFATVKSFLLLDFLMHQAIVSTNAYG